MGKTPASADIPTRQLPRCPHCKGSVEKMISLYRCWRCHLWLSESQVMPAKRKDTPAPAIVQTVTSPPEQGIAIDATEIFPPATRVVSHV